MKRFAITSALAAMLVATTPAHADDGLFTGDVRLACEAVLCLASGSRPSECTPSIKKYFSISAKKFKDTVKKRKNFLSLCPKASQEDINAIIVANPPEPDQPEPVVVVTNPNAIPENTMPLPEFTGTPDEMRAEIARLTPLWNAQTALSSAARLVVEKCVEVNGRVQDGNCAAEMADYDAKRLPAIALREEIYRLQRLVN